MVAREGTIVKIDKNLKSEKSRVKKVRTKRKKKRLGQIHKPESEHIRQMQFIVYFFPSSDFRRPRSNEILVVVSTPNAQSFTS